MFRFFQARIAALPGGTSSQGIIDTSKLRRKQADVVQS